jgi:Dolichyl-phosphate-mannose-protein mannosyltransferase
MRQNLRWLVPLALCLVMAVAAWLRMAWLGNVFQSSDNAELADKILRNGGWEWMVYEKYGLLINAWVKLFTGVFCLLGGHLNEFWWKFPVALAGVLSVPLAYRFSRKMGLGQGLSLLGAAALAMLPIHVFQSRYLWGYEVLGLLFLLLAVPALVSYLETPSLKRGLLASLMLGLYLISHGYFLPLVPALVMMMALLGPEPIWWRRLLQNAWGLVRHMVLLFPLGFWPLYRASLKHALRKESHFGFYLDDHFMGFLGNLGWLLLALLVLGWLAPLWCPKPRRKTVAVVAGLSLLYLAPLFFASPPGVTVVRGYMLIGCGMGVLAFAMGVEGLAAKWSQALQVLGWGAALLTGIFTADRLFVREFQSGLPNFLMVQVERGSVPFDPLVKAMGYLYRKHVPTGKRALALEPLLEPPVFRYYFGGSKRDLTFYDLPQETYTDQYHKYEDSADVLIVGDLHPRFPDERKYEYRSQIVSVEYIQMLEIYARPGTMAHLGTIYGADSLNALFDKEFSPTVKLF